MPDEDQFAREKIFKRDQLLIFANDWVRTLLPWQSYIRAETFLGTRSFVASLHNAAAGAGDDHKTGLSDLSPKLDRLPVLHTGGEGAGGAEHRDFAKL